MTRLLVIKPSSLGDVIHGLPALALIRRRIGASLERVSWVVNDSFAGLLEMAPGIDRIVRFPRKTMWKRGVLNAFRKELQAETYDVAIDFQGLLRSGLMARFSHAPRKIGFADGRECSPWFYTEAIKVPKGHAVERNLMLADAAFPMMADDVHAPTGPLLHVEPVQRAEAVKALQAEQGQPVLAVGHSSRWNSKNWPVPFFADVLDRVAERHPEIRIWLLGGPDEKERSQRVARACRKAVPLDLTGTSSMTGLVALLAESDALLTNDSGPMHLAAALDIPTVALFGATNPDLTGPYGPPGRHTVFRSQCPKSPCFIHDCPCGEGACARGTAPETVADAVLKAMKL